MQRQHRNPEPLTIGDKVAYSTQFLKSIGESHGRMARGRGTVSEREVVTEDFILISVAWNDTSLPLKIRETNLAKVGPNSRFANC